MLDVSLCRNFQQGSVSTPYTDLSTGTRIITRYLTAYPNIESTIDNTQYLAEQICIARHILLLDEPTYRARVEFIFSQQTEAAFELLYKIHKEWLRVFYNSSAFARLASTTSGDQNLQLMAAGSVIALDDQISRRVAVTGAEATNPTLARIVFARGAATPGFTAMRASPIGRRLWVVFGISALLTTYVSTSAEIPSPESILRTRLPSYSFADEFARAASVEVIAVALATATTIGLNHAVRTLLAGTRLAAVVGSRGLGPRFGAALLLSAAFVAIDAIARHIAREYQINSLSSDVISAIQGLTSRGAGRLSSLDAIQIHTGHLRSLYLDHNIAGVEFLPDDWRANYHLDTNEVAWVIRQHLDPLMESDAGSQGNVSCGQFSGPFSVDPGTLAVRKLELNLYRIYVREGISVFDQEISRLKPILAQNVRAFQTCIGLHPVDDYIRQRTQVLLEQLLAKIGYYERWRSGVVRANNNCQELTLAPSVYQDSCDTFVELRNLTSADTLPARNAAVVQRFEIDFSRNSVSEPIGRSGLRLQRDFTVTGSFNPEYNGPTNQVVLYLLLNQRGGIEPIIERAKASYANESAQIFGEATKIRDENRFTFMRAYLAELARMEVMNGDGAWSGTSAMENRNATAISYILARMRNFVRVRADFNLAALSMAQSGGGFSSFNQPYVDISPEVAPVFIRGGTSLPNTLLRVSNFSACVTRIFGFRNTLSEPSGNFSFDCASIGLDRAAALRTFNLESDSVGSRLRSLFQSNRIAKDRLCQDYYCLPFGIALILDAKKTEILDNTDPADRTNVEILLNEYIATLKDQAFAAFQSAIDKSMMLDINYATALRR